MEKEKSGADGIIKPKLLPYAVFLDLDTLLVALTNLLDREFPPGLGSIPGVSPFLLVAAHSAKNTFNAIRYLVADSPSDPIRKPEYALAAGPMLRSLADLLFTIIFMREDFASRVTWYHKSGWRELKERLDRYKAEYGALPEFQAWIKGYEVSLDVGGKEYGVTESEKANLKSLKYWPIPNQMLRMSDLSADNRIFLQYVEDWIYKEPSADSHMTSVAFILRQVILLMKKEHGREEKLEQIKSDTISMALTLILAIVTEVNNICKFELDKKLAYFWRILIEYWREAKGLYERRYQSMLSEKASIPTAEPPASEAF